MKNDYDHNRKYSPQQNHDTKSQKKTRHPQTYQKTVLSTTRKATPQNRKFVKYQIQITQFLKGTMKKHTQK